ncbi:DUF3667 domain-containing protein [Sunxiuqinia sp. A32]|uniref:DUF3667 domain-containing protein n=1 Tax=Sunxiuqinia sp. A32 TaxID=3461496 RepID=UPI0040465FBC
MRKWLKKEKVPVSELEKHACLNCEYIFKGHFCPNCGQSVNEFDRPFGFIFYDFLGNVVAFDSRLWKTFLNLICRPGFLTKEFFKGKRETYAPPFRVYIFLSFILFLFLQIATSRSLTTALDYSFNDPSKAADSELLSGTDSLAVDLKVVDQPDNSKTVSFDIDWSKVLHQENLKASLSSIASQLEERLKVTDDEDSRRTLVVLIDICRSPDQLMTRILKYLSWAFFILLPVFALLFKLFYIRRKVNYIRHLVFSVHFHSFLFLVFALIIGVNLSFSGSWTWYLLFLLMLLPVYLFIAMKSFYGQGVFKVFLKGTLISILYNLIVLMAFSYVVMNAISNL